MGETERSSIASVLISPEHFLYVSQNVVVVVYTCMSIQEYVCTCMCVCVCVCVRELSE